jgi:hypothetical protein
MPVPISFISSALQLTSIVLLSLILGTVFGIWRGYDATTYAPSTFVEMHQGAVRGLNVILPMFGLVTLMITASLAILSRDRPGVLWLYGLAFAAIAVAGLVTRFGNQPINEQVMGWTVTNFPADWTTIRDRWASLNAVRVVSSFAGELLLVSAIFADRG